MPLLDTQNPAMDWERKVRIRRPCFSPGMSLSISLPWMYSRFKFSKCASTLGSATIKAVECDNAKIDSSNFSIFQDAAVVDPSPIASDVHLLSIVAQDEPEYF